MPSTTQLRGDLADLSGLAAEDLDALWLEVTNAVEAAEALRDLLPELVETYGSEAAFVAADWYDETREERAVAGRFAAIPADLGESGAIALAGWGSAPLFAAEPDWDAAKTLIQGGLQRRIVNYARRTVMGSSIADPQADGWRRVGSPRCDFCRMLIGRGAVYSESTADFDAHDHCNCAAEPAWR